MKKAFTILLSAIMIITGLGGCSKKMDVTELIKMHKMQMTMLLHVQSI